MIRIWKAFLNSLSGLKDVILHERAFKQELILLCILIPSIFIISVPLYLKLLLLISHLFVLIIELLNSAIEAVVDLASPQYHKLAKQAKNYGSAAVMLSIIVVIILWAFALGVIFS